MLPACRERLYAAMSRGLPGRHRRAHPRRPPRPATTRRDRRPACRTRRGPRARPPGGSHGEVRPYLDPSARRGGALRRPLEGLVEIRHVNDVVAAHLLLHLGEGAVLYQPLAVPLPHGGGRGRRLQAGTPDHDAGIHQRLRVSAIGTPVGVLAGRVRARAEIRFALVDQDRVFHGFSSVMGWVGLSSLHSHDVRPSPISTGPALLTFPPHPALSPSGGEGTAG